MGVAVPVGAAVAEAEADGVTETVGLGTAVGVLLADVALGVGEAELGLLVRAGELLWAGAGALD